MTSTLSKIPRWCWYVFPLAVLLIIVLSIWGGGRVLWSRLGSPSVDSVDPTAPPALTPEVAEEMKEEAKEETATEKERIKEKYDEERNRVDKWLRGE